MVLVVGMAGKLSADAKAGYEYCQSTSARMLDFTATGALETQVEELLKTDVVVDALLGIGAQGEVRSYYRQIIEAINTGPADVLAVDIPSGLDADTGAVLGIAVTAAVTVTFIGLKRGLLTFQGPDHTGELVFADLAVPRDIYAEVDSSCVRLDYAELIKFLLPRQRNAHKNHFGHLLVVGGDQGMGGAVAMAAVAAMRSGAGLVTVATHPSHAGFIMAQQPELMVRGIADSAALDTLLSKASVVVLGPGLGQSDWSNMISKNVQSSCDEADRPMVVDADGLNLLAKSPRKNPHWILTPHPGEAANLLKTQVPSIQKDRFAAALAVQERYGGNVVLKGCGSIVQSTGTSLSAYGNPGMSSAGMGDVLSGVIGALLAQGCSQEIAAQLGVVVHSFAADQCTAIEGERGLLATDLIAGIRRLLNDI